MNNPLRRTAVIEHLQSLRQGIEERVRAEQALEQLSSREAPSEEQTLQEELARCHNEYDSQRRALDDDYQQELTTLADRHRTERSESEGELNRLCVEIERQAREETAAVQRRHDDSSWVVSSVLDDSSEESPRRQYERAAALLEKSQEQQKVLLSQLQASVQRSMQERGWEPSSTDPPSDIPREMEQLSSRFQQAIDEAHDGLRRMRSLLLPRLFIGFRPLWLFVLATLVIAAPGYFALNPGLLNLTVVPSDPAWIGIIAGAASVISLVLLGVLYAIASMQLSDIFSEIREHQATAEACHEKWMAESQRDFAKREKELLRRQEDLERQRREQLSRFQSAHDQKLAEIDAGRKRQLEEARSRFTNRFAEIDERYQSDRQRIESGHLQRKSRLESEFEQTRNRLQRDLENSLARRKEQQRQALQKLKESWSKTLATIQTAESESSAASHERFADWTSLSSSEWQPPEQVSNGIRLGEFVISTSQLPHGTPREPSLDHLSAEYRFPVILPFPESASVLFKTQGAQGRRDAVRAMQVLLLRMLTLIPPGKLRLTVFDPIGLGESFSGLMHLADYDELLITSRIWTESAHIESQLASLTEHMENVLQKYLRNEFASIEDYNRFAGEVAEPYHVLVVTDFPSRFSEQAAQRLVSVATSGPRCGVFLLMSADQQAALPHGFDLAHVESSGSTFSWKDDAFRAATPELSDWPLVVDSPPPPETFTAIVKNVGEASKDIRRVEVSFSRVAPAPEDVWTSDSRRGIDLPLGRAGAMKLQHLRLGQGTSQHMLVAGKTGSGKSTFFHALITGAALHYSPEEVNFYLVDFKKGVEFRAYAAMKLPHARVIAIESDREFGVSVLQRLDAILHERGDLFRHQGVQDIGAYRDRSPRSTLPRILLVIDEFQEFFVEDDQLSQTAGLLLDRLVRQGRAFGIHVILGSQTLGGAYSLARSTLGQIAVRVALQCGEADAHLILSEENTAARLLTRPGEAIYNDANGRVEGNHPFQIAWLPDDEREAYLTVIAQLSEARHFRREPAIVFEGNVPADPARNSRLVHLLTSETLPEQQLAPATGIWLGEAVQIGPPTSVTFSRQAGSNLLIAGSDAEAATGILANGIITLAAGRTASPHSAIDEPTQYWIFDGNPVGTTDSELWKRVAQVVGPATRIITPPAAAGALEELSAILERRRQEEPARYQPLFVVVTSLSKFRDLRKSEEDFGFGRFGSQDAESTRPPDKAFANLLANGPEVGIHTLLWVDSYGNVERWFQRQTLKEFELRVLLQMNAGDSSNLIDSPAASRLGVHRALLYREETGTIEKFRPYGPPQGPWLDWVQNQLQGLRAALEPATDLDEFPVA